jgi:hypothetical protein
MTTVLIHYHYVKLFCQTDGLINQLFGIVIFMVFIQASFTDQHVSLLSVRAINTNSGRHGLSAGLLAVAAVAIAGLVLLDQARIYYLGLRLTDGFQGQPVFDPVAEIVDVL